MKYEYSYGWPIPHYFSENPTDYTICYTTDCDRKSDFDMMLGWKWKVHSSILMKWPYFCNIVEFGGSEVEDKFISIPYTEGFCLRTLLEFLYGDKYDRNRMRHMMQTVGQEFGLVDAFGKPYEVFKDAV